MLWAVQFEKVFSPLASASGRLVVSLVASRHQCAVDKSSNLERVPSEVIAMSASFGVGVSTGGRTHSDGFAVSRQWGIARAFGSGV